MTTANLSRPYDVVLYGATSFVGQLTAEALLKYLGKPDAEGVYTDPHNGQTVRLAIAGRSRDKLEQLKTRLNAPLLPVLSADSTDSGSLNTLAQSTRLIISTVGPYLLYGEPLIRACAENGTHYNDLTGEALWTRRMLDKYQQAARQSGARIVNSCGFDSVPSDLGVWFTQEAAKSAGGSVCDNIRMRVAKIKGGYSGGTVASMLELYRLAAADAQVRAQLDNAYLLNDDDAPPTVAQPRLNSPVYAPDEAHWLAPFVMAGINTRVVHRSNYLSGYTYGKDFTYQEAVWLPGDRHGRIAAYKMSLGMKAIALAAGFGFTRKLLAEHVLPKPGEGPSREMQEKGYFELRFLGSRHGKAVIETQVRGDKDPGYAGTAKMLVQAALCTLNDAPENTAGGFWTPAALLAEALLPRLENYAGLTFTKV